MIVNPEIVEASGEWSYERGLPLGARHAVRDRPPQGRDPPRHRARRQRDRIEGDEILGRVFQHEIDHLDGVLLLDRLDRTSARRRCARYREQTSLRMDAPAHRPADRHGAIAPCASSFSARPADAVPPLRPSSRPATTSRSWSRSPIAARSRGAAATQPGKAAAIELGLPVVTPERPRDRRPGAGHGRRAGRRRRVRPAPPDCVARRRCRTAS